MGSVVNRGQSVVAHCLRVLDWLVALYNRLSGFNLLQLAGHPVVLSQRLYSITAYWSPCRTVLEVSLGYSLLVSL